MSYSNIINRSFLLLLPFLFTGCYTQFQTYDRFPLENDRYADYYAWDGFEEGNAAQTPSSQNVDSVYYDEGYLDDELAMYLDEYYYIDYETARWYKEHFSNKLYWEGYRDGYNEGYFAGWNGLYPYSARFSMNRYHYYPGYTGAFDYYDFYRYPFYVSIWGNRRNCGGIYGGFGYAYYYGSNCFYGYGYGYGYDYRYFGTIRNSRRADIYRKGPRNSGLTNSIDSRTRGTDLRRTNNNGSRSRTNSGITRNRTSNTSIRVRGAGSSVGRSSSGTVGRSRSSSVGKNRSSSGTRSRNSGSSVGKRSSSGSNGNSGTRERGSDLSSRSSSYRLGDLGSNGQTFTIPSRRVPTRTNTQTARKSRITLGDFIFGPARTSSTIRNSTSGSSVRRATSSVKRSSYKPKTRSGGSTVKRSSSSSRSSGSKSRGSSSSSSSKKRSRGNN